MHRHLLRIIIGFALFGTGLHIVMVATGYVTGGTAPIIDRALGPAEAGRAIDPIPSALVVTAIVIGFAVTAIMLAYAVRLHSARKTFRHRRLHGVEMVASLFHPLNIFLLGLAGGFAIPLLVRIGNCVAFSGVLHSHSSGLGSSAPFRCFAFSAASRPSRC